MKKFILSIIVLLLLTGCGGLYDLNNFILPGDEEFLKVINSLDTPKKICEYMEENFEFKLHRPLWNPYQTWLANIKNKAGDCNDHSTFAIFVAHWNGYEVYQIGVGYKEGFRIIGHALGVFVENGKYTYSSDTNYFPVFVDTFKGIVMDRIPDYIFYTVYDYDMNIVETAYKN